MAFLDFFYFVFVSYQVWLQLILHFVIKVSFWFFFSWFAPASCQNYMLQGREMESIFRMIVIRVKKLPRRFIRSLISRLYCSYFISIQHYSILKNWTLHFKLNITQEMAEKLERMELNLEFKDKVCVIFL